MSTAPSVVSGYSAEFLAAMNPTAKKATETSMDLTQDRFLKLLTTQLKNQDPLNPLDNAQMTSQMAQISTVNGIEKLNATLQKLTASSTEAQVIQASSMLGREVLVEGSELRIGRTNGQFSGGVGGFELTEPADRVTVRITDVNGLTMRTLEMGARQAGLQEFDWDGKTDQGVDVAAGLYRFSIEGTRGDTKLSPKGMQSAIVTGIVRDSSGTGVSLQIVGPAGAAYQIAASGVKQIF